MRITVSSPALSLLLLALTAAPGLTQVDPPAASPRDVAPGRPRLVLQITVDQLRGDLVRRYADRWGEGGFRRLLEQGAVFANAHHGHANTETIVGHATLATGAHPATHGMIGNLWRDRADGLPRYNIEDAQFPLLGAAAGVDKATEIDSTQKAARSDGRSPRAIKVSTFGDELTLYTGGRAKVFGVSVKDRGAVSMAGHTGQAYWFSKATGGFVTSSYYRDEFPAWVTSWNAARHLERYAQGEWALAREQAGYLFGDRDDRSYETDLAGFGRTFPHPYGAADGKYFTTLLTLSPAGDELTLDFALALFEAEGLGQDEVTDYLSISFSSTDYVGHMFGPSSLEAEDNLLRLDRTLARLLDQVDERVGLDQTIVVLSADHGGPEAPGYLRSLGFDADYISNAEDMKAAVHTALELRFGRGEELLLGYTHPYVYLNQAEIEARGLEREEVAAVVAASLEQQPGIARAFNSQALLEGRVADSRLARSVVRNLDPSRSGDIYVVTSPQHFVNDFDGLMVAATHGSPWRYDTHVPVIFLGPGIEPRVVQREVLTVDVAATLAALVGTKPPSGCEGQPLLELFR